MPGSHLASGYRLPAIKPAQTPKASRQETYLDAIRASPDWAGMKYFGWQYGSQSAGGEATFQILSGFSSWTAV
jgi:hypothetical protein